MLMYTITRHHKSFKRILSIVFVIIVTMSLPALSVTSAAVEPGYWYDVQSLEARDLGVSGFSGLGYIPDAEAFFSLDASTEQILVFTMRGELQSSSPASLNISNPLNLTYYPQSSSLVTLNTSSGLLAVGTDSGGNESLQTELFAESQLVDDSVQNPQGMTYNPLDGSLYILDASVLEIVKISSSGESQLSRSASTETIQISSLRNSDLLGLAFNPEDGYYYAYSPEGNTLYAINNNGEIVSSRDLSKLNIESFSGITFAPSSNTTDEPTQTNLFLTDSGSASSDAQVIELDITETIVSDEVIQDYLPVTLVNTIDSSLWSPPNTDASGLEYLIDMASSDPANNSLLVSDADIEETYEIDGEEYPAPYWEGTNVWQSTLSGSVLGTCDTTIPPIESVEPSGLAANPVTGEVFIADDVAREIFIINPGPDSTFCTADDTVTSFDTSAIGSNDPEGIAYGAGKLFIADGVGQELYIVDPGLNGIFEGSAKDDVISNYDTATLYGLEDPEGIGYHWERGTIFLVDRVKTDMVEVSITGGLLNKYDLKALEISNPSGVGVGWSSQNTGVMNVFISQRGEDNDQVRDQNDGKIYEVSLGTVSVPSIDLSITKTVNVDEIRPGKDVTYTIVVSHNGPRTDLVSGIHVKDIFPAGLKNIEWTCTVTGAFAGSACSNTSGSGNIDELIDLAAGKAATFSVTAEVDYPAAGTVITNTATVTAPVTISDPLTGNNSASDTFSALENTYLCGDDPTMVGCWPFEEGSGTEIFDSSSYFNDGTVIDNPLWSPGKIGSYALDLNGTTQYATIEDDATLDLTDAITIMAWIKPEQYATQEIVKKAQSGNTDGYELALAETGTTQYSNRVFFRINQSTYGNTYRVTSTTEYPIDGAWMHVAGTFDGTTLHLYINGVLEASTDATGQTIATNNFPVHLGASPGTFLRAFMGGLDDVRIYNRALSQSEIAELANPPVAVDDSYATNEDTPLSQTDPGVLGNDTDDDPITAIKVTEPSNGSVTLNSDGSFTYTPSADFNGSDSFTYKANDGKLDSNIATVTISVNPVNDDPIAVDDSATTNQDTPVVITVRDNDSDVEGDTLTVTDVSTPANGTAMISNAGTTVTYTPDSFYFGPDSFTYTISDGQGGTDTATVNITVNEIVDNTPPSISFVTPLTGGTLQKPRALLIVNASDAETAVVRVEFEAYYSNSWHPLGTDYDSADGWRYQWSTSLITDSSVKVKAIAYDFGGNPQPAEEVNISLTQIMTNGSGYQYREGSTEPTPAQQAPEAAAQAGPLEASSQPGINPGMYLFRTWTNWWKYLIY